jgi:hypothetical protein
MALFDFDPYDNEGGLPLLTWFDTELPEVTTTTAVSGVNVTDAPTVPSPTVQVDAQVTGVNVTDGPTVPSPTVQVDVAVTGANVTDTPTVPDPTVTTSAAAQVTGVNVEDSPTVPSPIVETVGGAVVLTLSLVSFCKRAFLKPQRIARRRGSEE